MRILFVMRHAGYVRNFEWVLRALASRGHTVELGFERTESRFPPPERLCRESNGGVSYSAVPARADRWAPFAFGLRQSVSYLRYLGPSYRRSSKLRARWARRTPGITVQAMRLSPLRSRRGLAYVDRLLRWAERRVPRCAEIDDYLHLGGYDLVLVTPLVDGPWQHDWVRSAREVGIPVALAVASWDNLTNKGVMFEPPDRTYVWNEIQRREALELQGLAPEAVVVVGAHTFDHWFEWQPRTSRADFCAEVGLDPHHPFLLYVCSSGFIAEDERPVVDQWVAALRADPALRDVGVLIRPHPLRGAIWQEHPLQAARNVSVWPPRGANPAEDEQRAAFYDSMFHSAAVVGANTTALIDAAIVGRRTFSMLVPELRGGQEETLHFHNLLPENGGALTVARSLPEHLAQLRSAIRSEDPDDWRESFLRRFVRPNGLADAAALRLTHELERLVPLRRPAERRSEEAPVV